MQIMNLYSLFLLLFNSSVHRRTGRGGGVRGAVAPPQFGQFVDINLGRESTLFRQNTIHV